MTDHGRLQKGTFYEKYIIFLKIVFFPKQQHVTASESAFIQPQMRNQEPHKHLTWRTLKKKKMAKSFQLALQSSSS